MRRGKPREVVRRTLLHASFSRISGARGVSSSCASVHCVLFSFFSFFFFLSLSACLPPPCLCSVSVGNTLSPLFIQLMSFESPSYSYRPPNKTDNTMADSLPPSEVYRQGALAQALKETLDELYQVKEALAYLLVFC
jgi:hypothetical protein